MGQYAQRIVRTNRVSLDGLGAWNSPSEISDAFVQLNREIENYHLTTSSWYGAQDSATKSRLSSAFVRWVRFLNDWQAWYADNDNMWDLSFGSTMSAVNEWRDRFRQASDTLVHAGFNIAMAEPYTSSEQLEYLQDQAEGSVFDNFAMPDMPGGGGALSEVTSTIKFVAVAAVALVAGYALFTVSPAIRAASTASAKRTKRRR